MPEQTATTRKQFTITRVFDAPRDLVWQAWTTEADAADWWHPRGIEIKPGSVSVDARVGGRYAYTMVNPADGRSIRRPASTARSRRPSGSCTPGGRRATPTTRRR